MIKIHKNDSIIDVIIKIKSCNKKEIVLDFPFWHPILHNNTSLKILKSKAGKKELIIITNDKTAQKIWKRLWIKYSQIWESDLLEYNYSIWEYTRYICKRYIAEMSQIFWWKNHDVVFNYQNKYWVKNSKIWLFLMWLIISIVLFIFIFYFAVNKTYIYITPEITIKTRWQNFIFKEVQENEITDNNVIKLHNISKLIQISHTFWTTWVDEETLTRSKWMATFYNHLNEKIELLPNTRIQDPNGILFTTDTQVIIPPATVSVTWSIIPWETQIKITSKIHDSEGNVVWTRANIWSWALLELPWLDSNQDKIYAKIHWYTAWANNEYTKQLTKNDIVNAKNILESKLRQQALNELKKQIIEDNKNNSINYELLWIDGILQYSDFEILWEDELQVWENLENFELSWKIKISSYSYNTERVLSALSTTIKTNILDNIEQLLFINDQSLNIWNIIYKDTSPLEIKATAQVEAFFAHNFLSKQNNYIEKLKNNIAWIKKEEAIKILLNNPKISDVKIELQPFFMSHISKITDNIIIKVVEK